MLAENRNCILVGFMGCGKSSVAQSIHNQIGIPVISIDEQIERRMRMPITEIFTCHGEEFFRNQESQLLEIIQKAERCLIDCGGGIVLRPDNRVALKKLGSVIYLHASPEFLYDQIKGQTHRPLLNVDDPLGTIRAMIQQREPLYREAHHVVISEHRSIEDIAAEVIDLMGWHPE